jgi:hypothetical protein
MICLWVWVLHGKTTGGFFFGGLSRCQGGRCSDSMSNSCTSQLSQKFKLTEKMLHNIYIQHLESMSFLVLESTFLAVSFE